MCIVKTLFKDALDVGVSSLINSITWIGEVYETILEIRLDPFSFSKGIQEQRVSAGLYM